jgi:hypothetical protein
MHCGLPAYEMWSLVSGYSEDEYRSSYEKKLAKTH